MPLYFNKLLQIIKNKLECIVLKQKAKNYETKLRHTALNIYLLISLLITFEFIIITQLLWYKWYTITAIDYF